MDKRQHRDEEPLAGRHGPQDRGVVERDALALARDRAPSVGPEQLLALQRATGDPSVTPLGARGDGSGQTAAPRTLRSMGTAVGKSPRNKVGEAIRRLRRRTGPRGGGEGGTGT